MIKFSISEQRAAVEMILDPQGGIPSGEIIRAAHAAVKTLAWIERHPDLARAIALLMREFPGAEIGRAS